jgi:membrane fusion protein, multidrug efflux system
MTTEKPTQIQGRSGKWRFLVGSIVCVLLVSLISGGIVLAYEMRLRTQTNQLSVEINRGPRVLVEPISSAGSADIYEVPVTIRGYFETPVYAKIPGYLKQLMVDKGDRVHRG